MKGYLDKYLPKKGLVLDAGGGPGRHTIELAKKGYDVVLLDLSAKCLEIARREIESAGVKEKVIEIHEGSIDDLSEFADERFDAVLCLGALSHLIERKDRELAASELIRVAKKGAPIFISAISLYGVYRTILQRLPYTSIDASREQIFSQGIFRKDKVERFEPESDKGFIDAYFFHPAKLKEMFEDLGIATLDMATCEGLSSHLRKETNEIYKNKEKWNTWLGIILRICNDPSIIGLGEHFLYIGRKE